MHCGEGASVLSIVLCYSLFIFCRLQYFARGVQAYIKQLRLALQGKTGDALKTEDVRNLLLMRSLYFSLFEHHILK